MPLTDHNLRRPSASKPFLSSLISTFKKLTKFPHLSWKTFNECENVYFSHEPRSLSTSPSRNASWRNVSQLRFSVFNCKINISCSSKTYILVDKNFLQFLDKVSSNIFCTFTVWINTKALQHSVWAWMNEWMKPANEHVNTRCTVMWQQARVL